jgi:hypothetical protein
MYLTSFTHCSRYGYIDPFGKIRDFTYSSGVSCDPAARLASSQTVDTSTRAARAGYFDYTTDRFIRPDGTKVKVVVNKANRARG